MEKLKDDNGNLLPDDIQDQMSAYIERIKAIQWFKPQAKINKKQTERQIKVALECFGVKAKIEWKKLETPEDWDAAWDAARGAAWDAAWGAAWDAARGAARGAAWDAAWDAARGAAWDAARGAAWDAARGAAWGVGDILASNLEAYKKKYPKGNFIQLIPLWELGLYPAGVVDGKFLVYVPPAHKE